MKQIMKPLNLGDTGSEVANLQEILLALYNNGDIVYDDINVVDKLFDEHEKQFFGSATAILVNTVREAYGISDSSGSQVANQSTIDRLNALLDTLQPAKFTVSGRVTHTSGKVITEACKVEIYHITYDRTVRIDTVDLAEDGTYSLSVDPTEAGHYTEDGVTYDNHINTTENNTIGVLVKREADSDNEYHPAATTVLAALTGDTNDDSIVLDAVLQASSIVVVSEYEDVYSALQAAIGEGNDISDIDLTDTEKLQVLVAKTGEREGLILTMVRAHKLALLLSVSADNIYGVLRQNISPDVPVLLRQPPAVIVNAIQVSRTNYIIPYVSDSAIDTFAAGLSTAVVSNMITNLNEQDPKDNAGFQVASHVFGGDTTLTGNFMKAAASYDATGTATFWEYLDTAYDFTVGQIEDIRSALTIADYAAGNPALANVFFTAFKTLEGISLGKWLVSLSSEAISALYAEAADDDSMFFYPDIVAGGTTGEKDLDYKSKLALTFAGVYPTEALSHNIEATPFDELKSGLAAFLEAHPTFDLRMTAMQDIAQKYNDGDDAYTLEEVGDPTAFLEELGIAQRLIGVTTDLTMISALADDGLHSSLQISRQPKENFIETYTDAAGSAEKAAAAYEKAAGNVMFVLNYAIEGKQNELDPTFQVLDGTLGSDAPRTVSASWSTLFGTLDGCNCSQCQSVYSPGAYLTDLLHFLKTQIPAAYTAVMARRPDIQDIELTCKNMNTAMPHIDIVNELLEDLVSKNAEYQLFARQTVADAATQRAVPEYINANTAGMTLFSTAFGNAPVNIETPYPALKDASYPWSLPYNYYKRQIDNHLALPGIKSPDISQRFSPNDKLEAWKDTVFTTLFAGTNNDEYDIIIDSASTPVYQYYGLKIDASTTLQKVPDPLDSAHDYPQTGTFTTTNWGAALADRVDILLQQTGLTYTELLELMDCYVINPVDSPRQLKFATSSNAPDDTCELRYLKITGTSDRTYDLLHRFVRLKRALGWTYYELDKALIAINPGIDTGTIDIDDETFRKLVQIKYLCGLLKISVSDVLSCWTDLNESSYHNFQGSDPVLMITDYQKLFRNAVLCDINAEHYPFPQTLGSYIADMQYPTAISYLSGIFNIKGSGLDTLLKHLGIQPGTGTTNLLLGIEELSLIRRHVLLMKSLKLAVEDWICYHQSIADNDAYGATVSGTYTMEADPFVSPFDAIRFVSFYKTGAGSHISRANMTYLLEDQFPDDVAENKHNGQIEKTLTSLRTELKKVAFPGYNAATDTDGAILKTLLLRIMDANSADHLSDIIANPYSGTDDHTAEDKTFVSKEMTFLVLSGDSDNLITYRTTSGLNPDYLDTAEKRRTQVAGSLKKYVLGAAITSYFTKQFKLKEEVVDSLLNDGIRVTVATSPSVVYNTAMQLFQDDVFIAGGDPLKRWPYVSSAYEDTNLQFRALLLLDKAALMVNSFRLVLSDVQNLWNASNALFDVLNPLECPVRLRSDAAPVRPAYRKWLNLVRMVEVRNFLGKDMETLYAAIAALPPTGAPGADFVSAIATAFKTGLKDIVTLLGTAGTDPGPSYDTVLRVAASDDYRSPFIYQRLIDCLEMQQSLPGTMEVLGGIAEAVTTAENQDDANEVIQVIKSQYDAAAWPGVIRPVNDRLRTERRDAMVAWLLANPPGDYKYKWLTADDIYQTLMVDVEMMSCMSTTRVLLAINTIQLWVDRVLLGLEGSLQLSKENSRQWHMWRKLYRVWEANRKVFIYPENWIEPELRDDKSPFFLELEKFLKQNDLTDENVTDAYQTYLERLEEVAHLDIIGHYPQIVKDDNGKTVDTIQHVWGRTRANPHIYFYRTRVNNIWNAWTKMETQIDSDSIAPVYWKGRLRVYWLTLTEKQLEENHRANEVGEQAHPKKYLSIDLNWTELKNGKWQPRQMGRDALQTEPYGPSKAIDMWIDYAGLHNFSKPYSIASFNDSFSFLKDSMMPYALLDDNDDLQIVVHGRKKVLWQSDLNVFYYLAGYADVYDENHDYTTYAQGLDVYYFNNAPISYEDYRGKFTIRHNKAHADKTNIPHAFFDTLIESFPYIPVKSRYKYVVLDTIEGYNHINGPTLNSNIKLLRHAPGFANAPDKAKYILTHKVVPDKNQKDYFLINSFFYQDYKNAFFVEMDNERNANMSYQPGTSMPGFSSILPYRFTNFAHDKVTDFRDQLYNKGLDALLDRDFITGLTDTMEFEATYWPTPLTSVVYPDNKVSFDYADPYSQYNWELFFHIPMLIANKLMQDQKFEEARKWYHYVFNPTVGDNTSSAAFWNFPVFNQQALSVAPPVDLMQDPNLQQAVDAWAHDPFKPHLVARTRVSAYMKNAVMKYLDNLVAWGDMLFRTDTRENINEATLLYVLAAQLLGKRPLRLSRRTAPSVQTYATLETAGLNAFSNAMVAIENILPRLSNNPGGRLGNGRQQEFYTPSMYYFCIPPNDKMMTYWDTLADRLFKIRNCRNIDGVERDLALYDPPIDPALLVKAAAAGLSLASVLSDINSPMPHYRFNVMSQKATELAQEVKGFGGQLLSALEKKDAEHLSLLRSSQELTLLDLVTEIKEQQVQDTVTQVNGLQQQQRMVTQRRDYYKKLVDGGLNVHELVHLNSLQQAIPLKIAQGVMQSLAGTLRVLPDAKVAAPTSAGTTLGGSNFGSAAEAISTALGITSSVNDVAGQMASTMGGYARRKEDWQLQLTTSNTELLQIDHQILGAQIRQAVAELELRNHKVQVENSRTMDEEMHNKFTNEDLYEWMVSELSFSYFQAYKLAMDVAKKAERCYRNELSIDDTSFIQPMYWDSLKKGLLAGEQLCFDIKRMEASYLDKNKRQLELTKHISLATFFPDKLIELKTPDVDGNNKCDISIPEWIFDMDYPGHHLRRIKSVSISIPCVAGPYTTVSCKLSLTSSKYRKNGLMNSLPTYDDAGQYKQLYGNIQSIATSHAQNDSGMFEFSFRDERYLPFEGAGAVGDWRIELPAVYSQFDYNSISDVILHVNYTALDEGGLAGAAKANVTDVLAQSAATGGFFRLFDLKREFANEWFLQGNDLKDGTLHKMMIKLRPEQFPYYTAGKEVDITKFVVKAIVKQTAAHIPDSLNFSYNDGSTIQDVPPVDFDGTSAEQEISLPIAGNTKLLKLIVKDGDDNVLSLDETFDEFVLIACCKLGDVYTEPADDDTYWPDPIPVPDAPIAWWKADAGVHLSGTYVTQWDDQTDNLWNAIAPDSGSRPTFTGGSIYNASGANSMLDFGSTMNLGTTYSLSFTGRMDAFGKQMLGRRDIVNHVKSGYGLKFDSWAEVAHYSNYDDGTRWYMTAIDPVTIGDRSRFLLTRHDQDIHVYQNDTLIASATASGNGNNGALLLDNLFGDSAANGFVGAIDEIVIYDRVLSTGDVTKLNNYLDTKYSL